MEIEKECNMEGDFTESLVEFSYSTTILQNKVFLFCTPKYLYSHFNNRYEFDIQNYANLHTDWQFMVNSVREKHEVFLINKVGLLAALLPELLVNPQYEADRKQLEILRSRYFKMLNGGSKWK